MEVELLDKEGEEEEVQRGVDDSKHQHNRPVGLIDAQDQVGDHDVDDAACSRSGHGEDLEQDQEDAGKNRVNDKEHGSGKDKEEVHGLGHAGEHGGDDQRDDNGLGLILVPLVGGDDKGEADADVGPQIVEGVAVEVGAIGEGLTRHCHLGNTDGIGAGDNLTTQRKGATHIGELERGVDEVVQTGGNEQLVEHAVDKQTDVARLLNDAGNGGDGTLNRRPNDAEASAHDPGDDDHDQERKANAREHRKGNGELLVRVLVEHGAGDATENDAAEHAGIEHLDAHNGGLAGSGKAEHAARIGKRAGGVEHDVVSLQEQEERHQGDQRSMALVLLCHGAGDAHAEQNREVVDDKHQRLVDNGAHKLERTGAQYGDQSANGLVGQNDAHNEQDAGNREIHHRLDDRLREHLQRRFEIELLFCGHSGTPLPFPQIKTDVPWTRP